MAQGIAGRTVLMLQDVWFRPFFRNCEVASKQYIADVQESFASITISTTASLSAGCHDRITAASGEFKFFQGGRSINVLVGSRIAHPLSHFGKKSIGINTPGMSEF